MPHARNALDGTRIYFEDDGGSGAPVVFHGGLLDSVGVVRHSPIARAMPRDEFRRIFVDHRGLGRSDKPHEPESYAMRLRAADPVAVLDEIGLERAHFVGTSWGGRLGFGLGEHAPERVRSLVSGGQHPYAMDPDGPLVRTVSEGIAASRSAGIAALVEAMEGFSSIRFQDPVRSRYLENDAAAIDAAWSAAMADGPVAMDLRDWRIPCLIFVGAADTDFQDQAARAASEIPDAEFIAVQESDHPGAHLEHEQVVPAVLRFLRR